MVARKGEFLPVLLGTGLGAYGMARLLHEAFGVRSLAFGRFPLRETAHSRIVKVLCPPNFDDDAVILETLMTTAEKHPGEKLLLLPLIEFYTNVVLEHYEQLSEVYLIPLPPKAIADQLLGKTSFYELCDQFGVPHPISYSFTATDLGSPGFGADWQIPFPVILKPSNTDLYPRVHFADKKKVYLLDNLEQVRTIAARIFEAGYDDELIVQEYLAGDESVMRVANIYSDRNSVMKFCSVGQVLLSEYNPQLVGNNNAILPVLGAGDLVASIRRLMDGVGYRGLANIDAMYDRKSGTYKLLEANLRPGATSFYTRGGGENLARFVVNDLVFQREIPEVENVAEELWLNVPYSVARHFAPASTKADLRGRKTGALHTLRYAPDRSWRREYEIFRLNLDRTADYLRYSKSRLNV